MTLGEIMGSIVLLIIIGVVFFGIVVVIAIVSGIIGLISSAAPGIIARLVARRDVQNLSDVVKENEGFAPPTGSEVNENNYD
jgi:hypothetical protein